MVFTKSVYIFNRSLRLSDNKGLIEALKESDRVIPVFIFTPEQITAKNKFRSMNGITFMIGCLEDLDGDLKKMGSKLFIFYGKPNDALDQILRQDRSIEAVFINKDYTKYAVRREKELTRVAEQNDCELLSVEDYLLHPVGTVVNGTGGYYSVFTPFYKKALKYAVDHPVANKRKNYITSKYSIKGTKTFQQIKKIDDYPDEIPEFEATRAEGLKRIKDINGQKNYSKDRDKLDHETTRLSPYIKFGLVSIREVYHKIYDLFGKNHDLIKQLYWREFYYNIAYNRPDLFDGNSFRESYDRIVWEDDNKMFNKWKNGTTGYPIVDAGMRELNQTGYMHNRSRLITSNFLVKHLFVDWRKGEKYYASKLIDYDPSVNNGSWQFTSSSGADSQPYFRMMNPWTQGERHDPDCQYIKKWIPELKDVPSEAIHNWEEYYDKYNVSYPKPCKHYDFHTLKKDSKKIYSKAFH